MCYFNLFISQNSNYEALELEFKYNGPVILNEALPKVFGVALLLSTYNVCVPVTGDMLQQLKRTVKINCTGPFT